MSDGNRLFIGIFLVCVGGALIVAMAISKPQAPLDSTLAPAFEIMGTPVQALNHLVTKVMPINALDEAELGTVIRNHYEATTDTTSATFRYLNEIVEHLDDSATKPFSYRVFLLDWQVPNAMALPGGVILVNEGLMETLETEAELAAVLGHEIGHIERSHVLDAVRFRLLADKVGAEPLGALADFTVRLLVQHAFSKTQEDDADEYGFSLLLESPYDPRGMGHSFGSLLKYQIERSGSRRSNQADPFRDYFSSHPPLEIREAAFRERAEAWWRSNADAERTLGEGHLAERVSVYRAIDNRLDEN